jgi:hypothetical protein
MTDEKKSPLQFFDSNGISVYRYRQLEAENAAFKARIETLQRQVDMLMRRQVFFDASFDMPTRH